MPSSLESAGTQNQSIYEETAAPLPACLSMVSDVNQNSYSAEVRGIENVGKPNTFNSFEITTSR
jgi:hypothetical protein